MSGRTAPSRALALLVAAACASIVLATIGRAISLPSSANVASLDQWLRGQGSIVAAFAIVWLVAIMLTAYVAFIGALGLLATLTRSAALVRITLRCAAPSLRVVLTPVAAATLTLASAMPAHAESRGAPPPSSVPVMQMVTTDGSAPPVMRVAAVIAPHVDAARAEHTVAPGDTFWSIAETAVRAHSADPSEATIVAYWRALIDENQSRLRVPGQPDLIYPGQVFELPPIS